MQVETISMKKHLKEKMYDILVVEDDPIQTIILKKLFQPYQEIYQVVFADSIAEATAYLDSNKVNAIVTDYNLDDGKGSDLIEYGHEVPIVIMTAVQDIDLVVELMKNDEIYDFVLKDYEGNFIEILHRMLEKAMKKFQLAKSLDRQKAQFKELVENINDVICRTDENGKIVFSSNQVASLTGYKSLELIGKHYDFWIPKEYINDVNNFYNAQISVRNEHSSFEFPILTKYRKTRWVGQTTRIRFDNDGNFLGFLFVIRDITTKKEAELQIQHQNERLQQQNEQIKRNYEELIKAKNSKKALGIVLFIAIFLFLISEAWLEPIIEDYVGEEYQMIGLAMKGVIALLLKPIDILLESFLLKRQVRLSRKTEV